MWTKLYPATTVNELLSVRGLIKGHGQVRVLKGVDLTVSQGEIVGVVGGSGAGKSTPVSATSGPHLNGAEILFGGESLSFHGVGQCPERWSRYRPSALGPGSGTERG